MTKFKNIRNIKLDDLDFLNLPEYETTDEEDGDEDENGSTIDAPINDLG
jgi:hypothetical protein